MNIKRNIKTIIFTLAVSTFSAGLLSAQEAVKQDAPKPAPINVSGVIFMDYSYLIESKDKLDSAKTVKTRDSFNLTRAYLNFDKKIDDVWSAKVTLDAGTYSTKDSAGNDEKGSYSFLKNAYGQFAPSFGVVDLKIQGGLVGTPVIGLIDGLNGSRWIYQNYIDKASDVLGNSSSYPIDPSSADTGLKAELSIMKMASLTGMYSNGDGYKTQTTDQYTINKAKYLTLNIKPINALNVFGYYHWHNIDTAPGSGAGNGADKNFVSYYGGGAAWSDKAIKVGAAYTMINGKNADVKQEANIMEFWANVNLEQFTSVPVLIIGRYAKGSYKDKAAAGAKKNEGSVIWAGAGYRLNSNVQFALMYKTDELTKKNSAGVKTSDVENSTMFVKSEIKF